MSRIVLACALATLIPLTARAEPVSIALHSASGGFSATGGTSADAAIIDLGQVFLPNVGSMGTFLFSNLWTWQDYRVGFDLGLGSGVSGVRLEIFDPLGDGDDGADPAAQPWYVPAGYSTSNNDDGFSFAQHSALTRSATFAGGAASVVADESTHRGDILMFSGVSGAEDARVAFGVRDSPGNRSFLLHISGIGSEEMMPTPEPASMVLLGTGLAAVAGAVRRRRRAAAKLGAAE